MMRVTALAIATVLFSQGALARAPLQQDPTVVNGFYAIGLADLVRKNCDSIQPRYITAYNFLKSLERYARDAGYTEAEIDALVDDRKSRRKLERKIRADLAARGASPETPEGYCAVGREEIAKGTQAGRLLRAE